MKLQHIEKSPYKNAFNMAWPAIIESFFVAFTGLIDSLMVSRLGSYAVAAVGLTTQPKFMGLSLFFAVNISVSALVARRRGENNKADANRILITAVIFILIASIIISSICLLFADNIISFCGSTQETHRSAVIYFRIIMGCMIFNCIQMGINSAQRGAGNTKITMITNVTSNTINIIMNFMLIEGHCGFPALGIHGAAIATVLGTLAASIMSICSICRNDSFVSFPYIIENKIKAAFQTLKSIVKIGYGIFFEQLLMRIGFTLTAIMAAKQGTFAMAAHQVGMNIMGLTFSFGDGLQAAAVALIGRSLGENNKDMARRYGRICMMYGGIIAGILCFLYYFGAEFLMSLFFKESEIISIGISIMRIIIFVVIFQIIQVVYMGCLRGAGDTLYTAAASTISVTIVRTAASYIFGYILGFGITGIWMGVLFDQFSRFCFASFRYKSGKWADIKI